MGESSSILRAHDSTYKVPEGFRDLVMGEGHYIRRALKVHTRKSICSELNLPETTFKASEGYVARRGPKIQEPLGLKFPSMPPFTREKNKVLLKFYNAIHEFSLT